VVAVPISTVGLIADQEICSLLKQDFG
jgi:hypothetical protein